MLILGDYNKLTVVRKSDIAFVLKDEENNEVFLHQNETNNQELEPGQEIDCFLYLDAKGRMSATLHKSYITINHPEFLKVVSVKENLGVFLDMGISKDVLLGKDDLPFDTSIWPQVDDEVYVNLKTRGKMVAKLVNFEDIKERESNLNLGEQTDGFVHIVGKIGIFIVTKDDSTILVRNALVREKYHIGQHVLVKITYKSPVGYEGSMILQKEHIRVDDADLIIDYLKNNNNKMPYTATTDSETIFEEFKLSRKAFKRALGYLYKARIVDFIDDQTVLIKGDKNE